MPPDLWGRKHNSGEEEPSGIKQLVFEVPCGGFWRLISHADQVHVVEALKCDEEGFAIICP